MLSSTTAIYSMAWPACVRIAQASCELCPSEKILGTSRMPREPSAWQDRQPFLTVSTHCAWLFMAGDILLPLSPVPGKLVRRRNLEQRIPVHAGIELRGSGSRGGRLDTEIHELARTRIDRCT